MRLPDPVLDEVFVQWAAWQSVVNHIMPPAVEPRDVPPREVAAALRAMSVEGLRRLAHLLVAHAHADTTEEAADLLQELWTMALNGRRPRFGTECGISSDDVEKLL